jgi:hypothetical protein
MLHDFLSQLIQARGIQKDPEADSLIQRAVAQQPDAAYLLVQRSLLLEQALKNAKGQVAQLENQLRSAQQGDRRFLDPNAWGNSGDVASEGLFDSGLNDGGSLDSTGGFFDGDGSDEGLFG